MRILFTQSDSITEFEEIEISECYDPETKERELFVTLYRFGWMQEEDKDMQRDCLEISGEYEISNDQEKTAAMDNYKKVLHKLLEKGYCKDTDFENFNWF